MPFESPSGAWKYVLKPKLHHMKEKTKKSVHKTVRTIKTKTSNPKIVPLPRSRHKQHKVVPVPKQ